MIFYVRGRLGAVDGQPFVLVTFLLLREFIVLERPEEISNYTVLVVLYVFCNYQLDVVNWSLFDVSHFVFCECNCIVFFFYIYQFYGDYSSCVNSSSVFEIKSSVHYINS